ncbi:40S ribosomal protein S17 [Mortierella antarctica]|nr:40S ribosomal protein S17 [Mortierella antarctica]
MDQWIISNNVADTEDHKDWVDQLDMYKDVRPATRSGSTEDLSTTNSSSSEEPHVREQPSLTINRVLHFSKKQGRVRTKTVKRASKVLIEKYYPRLTLDFQTNKKIASEVAIIPSKRLRNKIAGFTTHLMKRIQRGPVRGISFKLQEEERERKDNYIPEVSALDTSAIEIDTETQNLLKSLNFEELAGVTAIEVKQTVVDTRKPRGDRKERA